MQSRKIHFLWQRPFLPFTKNLRLFFKFIFMFMGVLAMCMNPVCALPTKPSRERALDPLELELEMAVNHHQDRGIYVRIS